MIRPHLRDLPPQGGLPNRFVLRPMRFSPAGVALWIDVQRSSETHFAIADDLFARQFGDAPEEIEKRCYLVTAPSGATAGTISAWFGGKGKEGDSENWGRIHWVAVRPDFQGLGLGRAALIYALHRLAALGHDQAWLSTSTARLPALKLYLDAGFLPDLTPEGAPEAWAIVRTHLAHPNLRV